MVFFDGYYFVFVKCWVVVVVVGVYCVGYYSGGGVVGFVVGVGVVVL